MREFKVVPLQVLGDGLEHETNPLVLGQEEQRTGFSAVELQPEEEVHRDVPDLCLVPTTGPIRKVVQATECKHRWVLLLDLCIIAHLFLLLDNCNDHLLLFVARFALSCRRSCRSRADLQPDTLRCTSSYHDLLLCASQILPVECQFLPSCRHL